MGEIYYCPDKNKWEIWASLPAYQPSMICWQTESGIQCTEGDSFVLTEGYIDIIYAGKSKCVPAAIYHTKWYTLRVKAGIDPSPTMGNITFIHWDAYCGGAANSWDIRLGGKVINSIMGIWNYQNDWNTTELSLPGYPNDLGGMIYNTDINILSGFYPMLWDINKDHAWRLDIKRGDTINTMYLQDNPKVSITQGGWFFGEFFLWKAGEKLPTEHILIEEDNSAGLYGINAFLRNESSLGQEHYTRLIGSIYSPPECLIYPEVKVYCYSPLRKCPENTCPVECKRNNIICCYDSNGESIENIPIDEYDFS